MTAIAGALLCVASLAFYVPAALGLIHARRVASIALPIGSPVQSDLITVDTTRLCSISVTANVRRQRPAISFPLRYSVLDATGQVLSSAETVVGSRDRAAWSSRTLLSRGDGWYRHEFGFDAFAVKGPGRIRVQAQLDPDTRSDEKKVEDLTLIVYDNTSEQRTPVTIGTILVVAGVVIAGFGMFKFVDAVLSQRSA
jgi:hypothetical protein